MLTDPFPDMKEKLMIKQEIKAHLENVILPFWQELKDTEYGGFCGFVGEDLRKDFRADKGCILNSRILWTFSTAAVLSGREDLKDCAQHAYDFLQRKRMLVIGLLCKDAHQMEHFHFALCHGITPPRSSLMSV